MDTITDRMESFINFHVESPSEIMSKFTSDRESSFEVLLYPNTNFPLPQSNHFYIIVHLAMKYIRDYYSDYYNITYSCPHLSFCWIDDKPYATLNMVMNEKFLSIKDTFVGNIPRTIEEIKNILDVCKTYNIPVMSRGKIII